MLAGYEIEQINHRQQTKKTRRGERSGSSKVIHKLKVMTINTRGIKSKTTSITAALHMNGTHIAAITETLLTGNEDVQISGYQWLGQNIPQKGGGVGFLIRNDIKSLIEEMNTPPSTTLESKWITLKSASKIAIGVVYGKQETASKEEVEQQFQELTTVTNRMQQQCEVIILGDLNAKIEINKQQCKQKLSRNGSLLQEFLKQTNTVINTTEKHQGTWTRVNRRNNSEKSVIDYIITGYPMKTKVVESATDTDNMYQIAGINQTDHNVITATINTEIAISSTTTRKWKKGTEDEWIQFNQELQKKWNNTRSENRKYTTLQNQIISCLQSTIGSNIIKSNRKEKITNPNIKDETKKKTAPEKF